ncbi:MAG: hypothetical protein LBF75_10740 [Treponema sp.]|nr:hypothetical protein [Treponema sp.]
MAVIPRRFGLVVFLFFCCWFSAGIDAQEALRTHTLITLLKERQIPFEERSLFADYGGFGSSVHVALPRSPHPEAEAVETLVLGIPLSSHEAGAYPGDVPGELPFGVELGLAFIEHIRAYGSSISIRVAFLGDEVSQLPADQQKVSHLGLQDLYATVDNPEHTLLVYLDIDSPPQSLVIHHGSGEYIAALTVLESLVKVWDSRQVPYSLAVTFNELYRLKLVEGPKVMNRTLRQDMHALYITGSPEKKVPVSLPFGTREGPPAADSLLSRGYLAGVLAEYADSLHLVTGNLDYHYIIINCLGNYFFIPEGLTVLLFMLVMGALFFLFLVYSIVYRDLVLVQWRIFIRYFWIPLIFLAFLVIALEAAGSLISLVARHYNLPLSLADYGRAGFKLVLALLFLSALFPLLDFIPIPKKANLYGNAAVILVILGVFIAAGLNITFIPVFMWVLLFTFLGGVIPIPVLVYLCAVITPLRALELLFLLLQSAAGTLPFASGRLAALFLAENRVISLYLAIITLPFMLILERGTALLERPKQKSKGSFFLYRLMFSLVLISGTLGALVFYTQHLGMHLPPAPVRRTIIETTLDEQPAGEGQKAAPILRIRSTTLPFLERQTLRITLEAQGTPRCFALYLEPETGTLPVIYAAPMPFELNHEQNSIRFILGEGPPHPFTTEIVLPRDFSGSLRVEALYNSWDPAIDKLPPPERDDYVLQVIKRVPFPRSA